jgi:hypothetical protein
MPSHIPKYGNYYEFGKDDLFYNRIKTYPKVEFFVYNDKVYYNNENQKASNFHTPSGHINLYELNVNRNNVSTEDDSQLIYPFVTKGGSFTSFSTVSTSKFNLDFVMGDEIQGSYPLTSSISIDQYDAALAGQKKRVLYSLKNSLNFYTAISGQYAYSSSYGDKEGQKLNIISIPSIFYGSNIKKGSVKLKYYVSGTLEAEASDKNRNGELIQTTASATSATGANVGDTVGVVLYNEGFIILTSSANISEHVEAYKPGSDDNKYNASWQYFASTGSYSSLSSSYSIEFEGVSYVQTVTMLAHAKENQLNFSNNPTFLSSSVPSTTSSQTYHEDAKHEIKNILSSSYKGHDANFKPVTYISKVGIYDHEKNLVAIAALANPVRKLEERGYTFKLKLDI